MIFVAVCHPEDIWRPTNCRCERVFFWCPDLIYLDILVDFFSPCIWRFGFGGRTGVPCYMIHGLFFYVNSIEFSHVNLGTMDFYSICRNFKCFRELFCDMCEDWKVLSENHHPSLWGVLGCCQSHPWDVQPQGTFGHLSSRSEFHRGRPTIGRWFSEGTNVVWASMSTFALGKSWYTGWWFGCHFLFSH